MATKVKDKQIDWSNFNDILTEVSSFKEIQREVKLQGLLLSAVEKENKKLKKELEEIKKFIYKK